jgi:DeoR family suf operon transcriptional repressor
MITIYYIDKTIAPGYTPYMTSTRELVLKALHARQRATINELAEDVGINPISMRHHIARLEAEGLVNSEEERHGVGRPRLVYFLTEAGFEKFPTRYVQLTLRLLEQLKETMPPAMVNTLFIQIAQDLAGDIASQPDYENLSMEQRLNRMKEILTREGFTIDWEQQGDQYYISEIHCPYYHVGQNHPEICSMDQVLISTALSVPVEKIKCILNGDSICTYVIPRSMEIRHE